MFRRQRRSLMIILWAALVFLLFWGFYLRLPDPLIQWTPVVLAHPDVRFVFQCLQLSGSLATLMLLVGGVPLMLTAFKQALERRYRTVLVLLGFSVGMLLIFALATVFVVLGTWRFDPNGGIYALLFLVTFLTIALTLSMMVSRLELNEHLIRFTRIPAIALTGFMTIALIATIIEITLLSRYAPLLFGLQLDLAHLSAFLPIISMVVTTICVAGALWYGFIKRPFTLSSTL